MDESSWLESKKAALTDSSKRGITGRRQRSTPELRGRLDKSKRKKMSFRVWGAEEIAEVSQHQSAGTAGPIPLGA